MAGRGPAPLPSHMRQRNRRKVGAAVLEARGTRKSPPEMPNPDGRVWHPLTMAWWRNAWASPMSGQWLEIDGDALGRVAILVDQFYQSPDPKVLAEIRLQEQRFGLSPLDRSRLSWECARADGADSRKARRTEAPRPTARDPRHFLMALK